MIRKKPKIDQGFTLAESLLAAAVLSMTVAAVILPFTAAAVNQQADARITTATCLAEELMEEILSKPFEDPDGAGALGPEAEEWTRGLFDNIDDYNGYSEAEGEIVSATGNVVVDPAAVGLSRSASTTYVYVSGQDVSQQPDFIRVNVEVRYRDEPLLNLTRLVHWPY
ncbi:MAG: type IV pilus modification PilV family protein [Planctomycetota bacterium]|jgi:prepilin-type N-terminal cleavage/methylation domain-containing protein